MVLEAEHMTKELTELEIGCANEGAGERDAVIAELARAAGSPPRRSVLPPWDAPKAPAPFFDSPVEAWTGSHEAIHMSPILPGEEWLAEE